MMRSTTGLLLVLAAIASQSMANAKAVVAHYMVGNVGSYSQADWEDDMRLAKEAGIDGFALNIAAQDTSNEASLKKGFQAAEKETFKLFFSFDYEAQGPWPDTKVIELVNQYKESKVYWKERTKPLVSTFEGASNAQDWTKIKAQTGCYFVPDWSSLPPDEAVKKDGVDGLFNWDSWPEGANPMSVDMDRQYRNALRDRTYMMGVSPWFYTNLPGWKKNWVWRGDDVWYERWKQVISLQPDIVQIITWNDWGESHYIGPIRESGLGLFNPGGEGKAPFNYVKDMPHDGWRRFLPYLIAQYKNSGQTSQPARPVDRAQEGLTVWYRRNYGAGADPSCNANSSSSGAAGNTTGNSAGHREKLLAPGVVLTDRVFFDALLGSDASVSVSIGGEALANTAWTGKPRGGTGVYHGSAPFGGHEGDVVVKVSRGNSVVAEVKGASISKSCGPGTAGMINWNAWVGTSKGSLNTTRRGVDM